VRHTQEKIKLGRAAIFL